jgi:hypothetical protein
MADINWKNHPAQAFWVAIWRPFEIALGVLVSAAFAFYVFPNRIEVSVVQAVQSIFNAVLPAAS